MKRFFPYIALAGGVLALAISPFFVRWAAAPGPVFSLYRTGLATLILLPFYLRAPREPGRPGAKKGAMLFPILGGIATIFDLVLWTSAVQLTRVANATLLGNIAPLWVSLAAWLIFRERLPRVFWIGLAFSLTGAVVVLGSDLILHPTLGQGDLMSVGSSMFYAAYFLAAQRGRRDLPALRYTWMMNLVCAAGLLLVVIISRQPLSGYSYQTYLMFVVSAVVTQVIGYFSVIYALGHLPASVVSPTLIGQPVLSAVLAIPLAGEMPALSQWAGGLIVMIGVFLIHRSQNSRSMGPAAVPAVQPARQTEPR